MIEKLFYAFTLSYALFISGAVQAAPASKDPVAELRRDFFSEKRRAMRELPPSTNLCSDPMDNGITTSPGTDRPVRSSPCNVVPGGTGGTPTLDFSFAVNTFDNYDQPGMVGLDMLETVYVVGHKDRGTIEVCDQFGCHEYSGFIDTAELSNQLVAAGYGRDVANTVADKAKSAFLRDARCNTPMAYGAAAVVTSQPGSLLEDRQQAAMTLFNAIKTSEQMFTVASAINSGIVTQGSGLQNPYFKMTYIDGGTESWPVLPAARFSGMKLGNTPKDYTPGTGTPQGCPV